TPSPSDPHEAITIANAILRPASLLAVNRPEVMCDEVVGHLMAEYQPLLDREAIVEAGIDPRIANLLLPLAYVVEMTCCTRDRAVYGYWQPPRPEISSHRFGQCARHATVCRRIFRVVGRGYQREPVRIVDSVGITVNIAILDSGHWTPEAVGVLGIHAADKAVSIGSIGHGKEPCRVGKV